MDQLRAQLDTAQGPRQAICVGNGRGKVVSECNIPSSLLMFVALCTHNNVIQRLCMLRKNILEYFEDIIYFTLQIQIQIYTVLDGVERK
ncbi:hypothetical protein RB195_003274 [Necator americanus]|uniref:Uncharacterized protein n=1 Tax=Necator americanus TaxID=51031 RepID=A0ABR1DN64_NECAM